ncbi:MAG: tRNA epoxyqueuosine(34) reductase QueG [bacterium]|nr:tRNA epoxyqueuosine(34) reductase QueG [bacterium]
MESAQLWDRLRHETLARGCVAVGVASARPFVEARAAAESRKAAGMHAGMHLTFGNPARSADITESFPWARSLVVAGYSYVPISGSPGPALPNRGRVARFATEDHYRGLRSALDHVGELLTDVGFEAATVADDNRLIDRAAAVRAGIGWWGKNTMVLAPGQGPWMLLGSVVTDAVLPPTEPMVRDCGTCSACLPACPTGALVAPGVLDARLCISFLLQSPDAIPELLRPLVGDRIYGCDDCLDACPPGSRLEATSLPQPRIDLLALLGLTDDDLLERFAHFYVPRRRAAYLRRNILVALGNSGDERAVPAVVSHLHSDNAMVRAHSAWALGQIGGTAAHTALGAAAATETDQDVQHEIAAAQR